MYSEAIKKKLGTMNDEADRATNEAGSIGPSQPQYREASPIVDPIHMDIPSSKPRGLKVKKMVFLPTLCCRQGCYQENLQN
jgi:hypothetical protein